MGVRDDRAEGGTGGSSTKGGSSEDGAKGGRKDRRKSELSHKLCHQSYQKKQLQNIRFNTTVLKK